MQIKLENVEKNIVKAEFEIEAEKVQDEYNKACRILAQRVNIPGFRKGKAPQKMVEQHLGVDYIKNTALDTLLPKAFVEIVEKNNLDIVIEPLLESIEFELGSPLKCVATFELKPEVKMGDYKGLTIEIEEYKIAEDAVEKELAVLAQRFASTKEVTDRKTNAADIVNIDFEGSVNGELIQGGSAKGYQLDLGNSNFIPGFAEAIVDKELNTEFDINVTFPETYHEEKLKGQPAIFKIKLNKILEKEIPQIDDELAKKVGPFKNVDELKADIVKYLEATKKNEEEKRYSQKLFETVIENANIDIQKSMVEREVGQLTEEFKATITQQGGSWEEVIEKEGKEKVDADLEKEALGRIKNSLVIQEIQKLEKIEVTQKDVEKKISDLARMYGMDTKTFLEQIKGNQNVLYSLSHQALTQKVMEFLAENNQVKVK